ncbi:hypothetical protein [Methylobacterium sp. ID0610]|uniref:hypothetical protein n=1 Tax=Methylobacterium carpenticola TaxID=3344827 RepID=UPI0036D0CB2A
MARGQPFHCPPGVTLRDRSEQRQAQLAKRQALMAKLAKNAADRRSSTPAAMASAPARLHRNVDAYMAALAAQPLHRLGESEVVQLTPAYVRIVRSAAEVAVDGSAQVVMPWPPGRLSPSAIVSLLAVAAVGSAERTIVTVQRSTETSRAPADEVRAIVYPYARSTHAQARQVQLDRHVLGTTNFEHVKRYMSGGGGAAKDYHQVLARVRQLNGTASDGRSYAEFEHPILDEIVPHGPPRGDRPSNSSLLWRTRNKTDITRQSRSGEADDPAKAAFYLYTLRAGDRIGVELRAIAKSPDLLILDLSRNGRDRLGWDWLERAKEMVNCIRTVHPTTGILVVADDPWTYRAARFDLLGVKLPGRKGKMMPATGHIVYSPTSGIVTDIGTRAIAIEGGAQPDADGFFGEVDRNIERLRALVNRLLTLGDQEGAATVRNLIATVRRSACLPGSLAELSRFLERETSTAIADDRLAIYRVASDVATLTDPRSLASQADAEHGTVTGARELMRKLEFATPMTSLLEAAIQPALRSSSRSVFVFRSDMVAEFAADRLSHDHPKLRARLNDNVILFGGERVLATVTGMPNSSRNQFKRAILVAPTRSAILATLAQPWLPDKVLVLADADTLAYAARDAEQLADEIDIAPLAARLRAFATRAAGRVAEIGRHAIQFEMPTDDVEFPTGAVVDLTGGVRGARNLLEIVLKNGQRILARRNTGIVLRDDGSATTAFIERPACQIRAGDEVCVIGPGFVERARTLINIRATAAEEIRNYHEQVTRRFGEIDGSSVQARLRALVARMGEPNVSTETAHYWIDLRDQLDKPLCDVVPHAPQDEATFLRFTRALGIGERLALTYWRWAVVAQRTHRLRYGNIFHDAFRGILTDTHAALASSQDRRAEIRTLRAMAEEHVSVVDEVRSIQAS